VIALLTLGASALLCGAYLRWARRRDIVAMPNARSSHRVPTPHGGGLPLLLAFCAGGLGASLAGVDFPPALVLLTCLALVLMLLGIVDDVRGLSVRLRLGVYTLVCLVFAGFLMRSGPGDLGLLPALLCALGLLWLMNLYNFMDGIDGLAALQAMAACLGIALIAADAPAYRLCCLLLAAAHGGFLVWNRPPARLFMGDTGSIPTGLLLGGLAVVGGLGGYVSPASWLILLAVFIVDATWTLLWRIVSGQPFTEPHRLHAYQRLSRQWGSHLRVDGLFLVIAIGWLLPLAWLASKYTEYSVFFVILAYLPLLYGMAKMNRFQ
jgi:Fuc2NAc and GlcNAc transferase